MTELTLAAGPSVAARDAAEPAARQYAQDFLTFGALAAVLAYMPGELLFSDNHAFPAELVLHVFALGAALACALYLRRVRVDAVDLALVAFAGLGVVSALLAVNPWFATRAVGLSISGVVVFLAARALARDGARERLTAFAAAAVTAAALSALLEAYGVIGEISDINRAPGGTIGNRNQMAHLLVIGLPVLAAHTLRARRRAELALGLAALAIVSAALVLSRSRGAWLAALLLVGVGLIACALRGRASLRGWTDARRAALLPAAFAVGAAAALLLPNTLEWKTPFADSVRGMVNFEYGSGRGRIVQYANTMGMVADHPLLGVGPGNWAVHYPRYASEGDPSYDARFVQPTTRLPQSDWFGLAAERGLAALLLLVAAGVLLALRAWRELGSGDEARAARGLTLLCTLAALAVVGTVDPVLLTPTAAFLAFLLLGALAADGARAREVALAGARRGIAVFAVLAVTAVPVAYGVRQAWAGYLYGSMADVPDYQRALRVNPGDYRANALLSTQLVRTGRCAQALPHIEAARRMYPTAPANDEMRDRCLKEIAESAPKVGADPAS